MKNVDEVTHLASQLKRENEGPAAAQIEDQLGQKIKRAQKEKTTELKCQIVTLSQLSLSVQCERKTLLTPGPKINPL